jgi:OH-DDVA meta-cleavage compound hydrolase
MIIDCHSHVSAPAELWAYKAGLLASRGSHGRGKVVLSNDQLMEALNAGQIGRLGHLPYMDLLHHDMHLISPRPYQMMHSEKPAKIVQWLHEEVNNIIHQQVQMLPDHFIGVAGLPQVGGEPLDLAIAELERTVNELGFKGCLLNPDPYENTNQYPPAMGDRYWYPLYEKLCELDVPAHIHGTGSLSPREPYTLRFINEETTAVFGLVNSTVFEDFPTLKIVVSHGGGAIPYQIGRFEAGSLRRDPERRFSHRLKKLYFDTTLYSRTRSSS